MGRFIQRGKTRFYFAASITDPGEPTVAELGAATEISDYVNEVTGFTFSSSKVDTPDFGNRFVSSIPGDDEAEDSSMTYYDLEAGEANPMRTAMPKDTDGYILIFPRGTAGANPAVGDEVDVWPVTVGSNNNIYSAATEAARRRVSFFVTTDPSLDVEVVA